MKRYKIFNESIEIDETEVDELMKERGWRDIMHTHHTEQFEQTAYYNQPYQSVDDYVNDFDAYMSGLADGSIDDEFLY